jgi:hypothetical protein
MAAHKETKNYNKICKEFIANSQSLSVKLAETTDIEVLNGLRDITNKNATLVLFWIELYRRYWDKKQAQKELKYTYSLEHILPQKWEQYWQNTPVKDEQDQIIVDREIAKRERYNKCYWLGNMTLLKSNLNSALRNHEFEKKIKGEGKKKGMEYYNELSITKEITEPFNNGDKIWDETKILYRTDQLGKEFLKIWS